MTFLFYRIHESWYFYFLFKCQFAIYQLDYTFKEYVDLALKVVKLSARYSSDLDEHQR